MFARIASQLRRAPRRRLFASLLTAVSGLILVPSALASDITVASPVAGSTSGSQVWVRAHNVGCNGLAPTAFGFSVDGGSTTMGVTAYDVDLANQWMSNGSHTIHWKSWTSAGICPVVDTWFNVGTASSSTPAPTSTSVSNVPSYATASSDLDTASNWQWEHDGGTPGWSSGSTAFPQTISWYDTSRQFYMSYGNYGGERWHLSFANDPNSTHFAIDTYIYVANPDQIQNLELDMNQVMGNGQTVIYGTQCSSISNTWEYTYTSNNAPHWSRSNIYCNPRSWQANTWHHVQIGFHRDGNGYVTHDWVTLDGNQSWFSNAGGSGGMWLGWAHGALLTNIQIDGAYGGGGSVNAYFHKFTVYRW